MNTNSWPPRQTDLMDKVNFMKQTDAYNGLSVWEISQSTVGTALIKPDLLTPVYPIRLILNFRRARARVRACVCVNATYTVGSIIGINCGITMKGTNPQITKSNYYSRFVNPFVAQFDLHLHYVVYFLTSYWMPWPLP